MIQVVILDIDGTLMDTNYLHTEAWARAFKEVDVLVPRVNIHRQIGKGSDQLIAEFIEDERKAEKVNALHSEFYGELQEHSYPLPGARRLIDELSEKRYDLWFVTSAKPEELKLHQERLGSEGKISGIVNSSDVERSKPAPDIFELALERSGGSPATTVSVGDAVWDVESAKAAGVRTVAVLTGGAYGSEELKEAGAVEVYEDCEALLQSGFPEWLG